MTLDVEAIRRDFPILHRSVRGGKRLVYLDNAATTQKPNAVIDAMTDYYRGYNANVHRSIHELGERATEAYVEAHMKVADFINAAGAEEVVFTKNCTEAINLVAYSYGLARLQPGDEVVLSLMEHHSNVVPWQQICKRTGAKLRVAPLTRDGRLDLDAYQELLGPRTKIVSVTAMSNVLGTVVPVQEVAKRAHEAGAVVLVDGAQSVPHLPTDVQRMGADFLAFSGHKMLGPTGIGVLWGKRELLADMEPFLYGGEMIRRVTHEQSSWNDLPWKFEAGTPNIAEAIGLAAAVDYLRKIGMENVHAHETDLLQYAFERLARVDGLKIYGPAPEHRGGVISMAFLDVHAHDLASLLDEQGVAIRAGHHCAQPLMSYLGVPSTARASFYVYNTREEVDALATALERAKAVFAR